MATYCTTNVPNYVSPDCDTPDPKDGGIKYLIWADDTIETVITDLTDASQWQTAIDDGNLEIIGPVYAEVPEGSPNEQRTTSCAPPQATTYSRTVTFQDFNTGTDNTSFWNTLKANSLGYKFMYIDCENDGYGWIDDTTVTVTRVHDPENDTGNVKWQGTTAWTAMDEETPVAIPIGSLTWG